MPVKPTDNTGNWGSLASNASILVDTAPFIYILESHPRFADRFGAAALVTHDRDFSKVAGMSILTGEA